jgi:hypothetical protein
MARLLESTSGLSERISHVECSLEMAATHHTVGNRLSSVSSQEKGRSPFGTSSRSTADDQTAESAPAVRTFEEDLYRSWVYRRSLARGPRTFSLATSTQLTQSWSMLSGLSLSNISNIAIQKLPIYAADLKNTEHYSFPNSYQYREAELDIERQGGDEHTVKATIRFQVPGPCIVVTSLGDHESTKAEDAGQLTKPPIMRRSSIYTADILEPNLRDPGVLTSPITEASASPLMTQRRLSDTSLSSTMPTSFYYRHPWTPVKLSSREFNNVM